uniref:Calcineurin-like phosphoesterase domain-containing protein n=1 Tax=Desulfobacca acetoxidans TaxID=60893 RepID=A0A7V6A4H2_9BACT
MQRREFLKTLTKGMAAAWVCQCWPAARLFSGESGATPNLSIACLADPHLADGNDKRPEARALARAVAEIKGLTPAPRLVLFAGDLAHDGDPAALALGEEILSDLAMPMLAVRGEGDGCPGKGQIGWRIFQEGRFCYPYEGVNLLGLEAMWQDGSHGPGFVLGEAQLRWLSEVLPRLDPASPLVVLSHPPLTPIYRPWGQWTQDSSPVLDRLAGFQNVLYIHGHVHSSAYASADGEAFSGTTHPSLVGRGWGEGETTSSPGRTLAFLTLTPALPHQGRARTNSARNGLKHISLPATSWPLPSALTGTPRQLRPGLGPRGCGWALLQHGGQTPQFRQILWQA